MAEGGSVPGWAERKEEGEEQRHEELARRLRAVQERRAASSGRHPIGRGLHYQPVGSAEAVLKVRSDLPAELRVGLFASPGSWPAWVRFSNGAGRRQKDAAPDVRGLAVKVLGVPGEKLIPALKDATTQDFLAIHTEVTAFRSAEEFVTVVEATAGSSLALLPTLLWRLGPLRAVSLLAALQRELGPPLPSYVERPFFSALPIRWGDEAVKYAFFPTRSSTPAEPIDRSKPGHYGPDLASRLRGGPIAFELRVQRFVDEPTTPIEDPSVRWSSPWTPVADLELPAQDPDDERGRALSARVEAASFDPWHAPVEFRPLGSLMRARNVAYRESVVARGAAPEPS